MENPFSFSGRVSRDYYTIVYFVTFILVVFIGAIPSECNDENYYLSIIQCYKSGIFLHWFKWITIPLLLICWMAAAVKRCHDIEASLMFVGTSRLFYEPSVPYENKFGKPPVKRR